MSDGEIKSMSESDPEFTKQINEWKAKNVDLDHKYKRQHINHKTCIFYSVLSLTFIFYLSFIGSVCYLLFSSSASDSFFAINKYSLILIGLLALLPSMWISILIKGLYGIKVNNKNLLSDIPLKEMAETINKAV